MPHPIPFTPPARPRRMAAALTAVLVLVACSTDEGPRSGPGTLTATLSSPNGAEGAALLTLLGDGIGEISAAGGTEVHGRAGDGSARVVLINEVGGALAFRVAVADTTQPPSTVVVEVAGPDDELRPSVDGYAVNFAR